MIFDEKANILTFLQNLHSRQFFSGALLQKPTLVPVTYTIGEYWGIVMLILDFQNTVYFYKIEKALICTTGSLIDYQ